MENQLLEMNELLAFMKENNASDLHLVPGKRPIIRIHGVLTDLEFDILTPDVIKNSCYSIISDSQKASLEETKELDFAYPVRGVGRFRGNYYYVEEGKLAAAFRMIPDTIPSLDELKSPAVFKELIKKEKGLILVTGATGSGKSTTLAAMLNEINQTERKHILTIEHPVEFMHQSKKSIFSYRNVDIDTKSFKNALKSALRQDPDIILIGEMRDKETIEAAITAAETGHLVFGTLHTNSAAQTINRIVDSFEGSEQEQIRNMLSFSLNAIVSQCLIPRNGGGRVAIHEILINNFAIANLIRENKNHQIYSQMQLNQQATGMRTQTQSLVEAVKANYITRELALRYSTNYNELMNLI
ncbi:type IV pilus twitching motility protein PilT [Campylobacter canadensis]|uniref:Type IV pilus twitching motility protein PilT n=1 Tax=Campylobacter canadensis TaxID=449520 RepID=A0ABS7WT00_9BACT|nr:type IV pilus twitching motility protein PilT [Campylobacter canadensis]MBZ7987643.1 type IV pilus twitching motility protein PilT [Campylobacter canadensis]MBZ7995034.1 type IV pilus twitching motility protein PilT [Campylobacter canadensis]MBZ7996976.1 type IV pilus twitching motility protein PilT [Campylobacter canadensis]MBZ7998820.1 type IV pilus twitching motility protein PilT [Campylobacter canadensis]MBZ8000455.1 type IV pilus twitching motility protein PilT [Campylobacter canadensi